MPGVRGDEPAGSGRRVRPACSGRSWARARSPRGPGASGRDGHRVAGAVAEQGRDGAGAAGGAPLLPVQQGGQPLGGAGGGEQQHPARGSTATGPEPGPSSHSRSSIRRPKIAGTLTTSKTVPQGRTTGAVGPLLPQRERAARIRSCRGEPGGPLRGDPRDVDPVLRVRCPSRTPPLMPSRSTGRDRPISEGCRKPGRDDGQVGYLAHPAYATQRMRLHMTPHCSHDRPRWLTGLPRSDRVGVLRPLAAAQQLPAELDHLLGVVLGPLRPLRDVRRASAGRTAAGRRAGPPRSPGTPRPGRSPPGTPASAPWPGRAGPAGRRSTPDRRSARVAGRLRGLEEQGRGA